jgi:hypothetical protein
MKLKTSRPYRGTDGEGSGIETGIPRNREEVTSKVPLLPGSDTAQASRLPALG